MEKTEFEEPTKLESVLPRTLIPKKGHQYDDDVGPNKTFQVTFVFGGQDQDVLCAMFLDENEAQAWIIASCHFGQPVMGYKYGVKLENTDGAGIQGGEQLNEAGKG